MKWLWWIYVSPMYMTTNKPERHIAKHCLHYIHVCLDSFCKLDLKSPSQPTGRQWKESFCSNKSHYWFFFICIFFWTKRLHTSYCRVWNYGTISSLSLKIHKNTVNFFVPVRKIVYCTLHPCCAAHGIIWDYFSLAYHLSTIIYFTRAAKIWAHNLQSIINGCKGPNHVYPCKMH